MTGIARVFVAFVILLSAGCMQKFRNVLMTPRADEAGIVKVYIDREGDLYPSEAHIEPYYFYLQHLRKKQERVIHEKSFATVEEALTRSDSLSIAYLHERYQLAVSDSIRFFIRLQQSIRKNLLNRIHNSFANNHTKHLVVFIHGFNDPQPDAQYFALRRLVLAYCKEPPVFLELYWDGLTALGDNPIIASIWGKARLNSAKVGLGLRNLLNGVDPEARITFITHSLGASVATHCLFNPSQWPSDFQEKLEAEYKSNKVKTLAHSSISLGMIAPAIDGMGTFSYMGNTVPAGSPLHLMRLAIAHNRYDYAVSKGGLFARSFGSTALGADAKDEVKKTLAIIEEKSPATRCTALSFAFADTAFTAKQKEHAVLFYQRNHAFPAFMKAIFD
jgi:hypothetical protein